MGRSNGKAEQPTMSAVLTRIRSTYREMTPTYRAVAKYVLEHHQELAFASVAQVGAAAGISPATVVRFADHLGLSGFTGLQSLARQALREAVDTVSQLKRSPRDSDARSVLAMAVRADIANLEQMLDRVGDESFARAVDLLAHARTVHLVALRSTFGLAQQFAFYLDWIGRSANVLSPGIGDLPEQILKVEPADACVALSFRRYTSDTIEIFRAARRAGATTLAVTDSELSPLADSADLTLTIPVLFPSFFESRVAVLSVMNALVLGVALADRARTLEALHRHEAAWSTHATYADEGFLNRFKAEVAAFAAAPVAADRGRAKHGGRQVSPAAARSGPRRRRVASN